MFKQSVINKIILNIRVKKKNELKNKVEELKIIAGQKPIITKNKKSLSKFNTKKNEIAGLKVSLRGKNLKNFLGKLININLPRLKHYKKKNKVIYDYYGNINITIRNYGDFIEFYIIKKIIKETALNMNIVTNIKNKNNIKKIIKNLNLDV